MRGLLPTLVAAATPRLLWACPLCFQSDAAHRAGYYGSTALLIALPLALGAGFFLWIRRSLRDEEAETPQSGPKRGDSPRETGRGSE